MEKAICVRGTLTNFPSTPEFAMEIVSQNDILTKQKNRGPENWIKACALETYFVASPPSVTLIPLRKLNGSAGNPGAGS